MNLIPHYWYCDTDISLAQPKGKRGTNNQRTTLKIALYWQLVTRSKYPILYKCITTNKQKLCDKFDLQADKNHKYIHTRAYIDITFKKIQYITSKLRPGQNILLLYKVESEMPFLHVLHTREKFKKLRKVQTTPKK